MRFPCSEKNVYKCGNVRVVHIGLKRTSKGKICANVYRYRVHEVEFPYVTEEDESKDKYRESSMKKANFILDIELSNKQEEVMGVPLYLLSYSKLRLIKKHL